MHAQRRQGVVYTLNLFQLFNQSPASKYPPHLPLTYLNSLSSRTVTKTRTDGHTSPLQIIMHLLIRLERFEDFFYGRMISFLLAWLIIIFLGILLTCYSLLEPPLISGPSQDSKEISCIMPRLDGRWRAHNSSRLGSMGSRRIWFHVYRVCGWRSTRYVRL